MKAKLVDFIDKITAYTNPSQFSVTLDEAHFWGWLSWESAAAFGNAVVNAVLCWFYDGKKNAVV